MPKPYWPKKNDYPLSRLNEGGIRLVRVTCRYCKRTHNYRLDDLIQIFGDMDTDDLPRRMTCEQGHTGLMDVEAFSPTGKEAVGLRIRRLVAIKIKRVPVWRED